MKVVLLSLFGFLINLGCVLGSDIYPSINWVPQNPLFVADGKNCLSGHRTLKVQLQSKVNFICPNTASVLQKTEVGVQTAKFNMYENLWIVYNEAAFNKCDTALKGQNKTNKLLLQCNTPTKLNYFPVLFAQFTAERDGLTFQGGRKYYFLGTSDGTESHINDTHGGHCNDTQNGIFMKIEVYICKKSNQTYTDDKCKEGVGVLQCPEPDRPTTAAAPTTAPAPTPTQTTAYSAYETSTKTIIVKTHEGPKLAQTGDDKVKKELEMWMAIAIVFACIFFCLVAIVIIYHICSRKWIHVKSIRHQSIDRKSSTKGPVEREVSVGGMSNRAFANSTIDIKSGGEDEKRKSDSPPHVFYDDVAVYAFVNENPAIISKGIDSGNSTLGIYENDLWNGPSEAGNIVFKNNTKDVLYDKGEKIKGNSPA